MPIEIIIPRPSVRLLGNLLSASLTVSMGACERARPEIKPAPPPPSEKVPEAPGPDNTVREMPPPAQPEPKVSRSGPRDSESSPRPLGLGPR